MASVEILLVDLAGLLLIVWMFNLIRRGRLYVGYGAIFVLVTAAGLVVLSVPAMLHRVNWLGTLLTSASGLVALAFTLVMLVYVLGQLTQLSNRLTSLAQELAIRRATDPDLNASPRSEPPAAER